MIVDTSEVGMLLSISIHDVLSSGWGDGLGHVQDFGFPVVLPSRFSPEQALISDSKRHLNKIININIQKQQNSSPTLAHHHFFS